MIRKTFEGIHWLEFEIFSEFPRLRHGVFLRHGGLSKEQFASFNLSYGMGDHPSHVDYHFQMVKEILNVPRICWAKQVHGKKISLIDCEWQNGQIESDAMATNHLNYGLMIHHADCQAAIIYDPIQHALAAIHCGWRGSVLNLYGEAVSTMKDRFGSNPANLLVGISPSLGPESAEFIHYRTELPESFWEYQVKPNYFNFWAISEMQLQQSGVLPHHIQVAGINTYSQPDDFFSHRRNKLRGANGTVAAICPPIS